MAPTPTSSDEDEHPEEEDQLAAGRVPAVAPGALGQQAGPAEFAAPQEVGPNLLNPPLPPGIMAEKATSTIPIEKFQSGVDDFDDWIEMFERAVKLATNAPAVRLPALFLDWLSISLDSAAKDVFRQIPTTATYAEAKTLLKKLLVDPCEAYKWQSMKTKITWDEKESFHALATRVKRAVDKYEKYLDAEGKKRSYFFRFREALPKPFKDSIDLGIEKDERTIENAILMASRVQMTRSDQEVTFAAAAMVENRVHGLELQVQALGTKIDKVLSLKDSEDKKDKDKKERGSGRDRRYDRNPSPRPRYSSGASTSRSPSRDRDRRDRGDRNRRDRGDRRDRGNRRDRDKRGEDRKSGRDNRRSGRDRDNRRSSPSTSQSRSRDKDRDRKRKGKEDDRKKSDKSDHRSLKTEDESSQDEVDEGILNACIESLQAKVAAQKGKRSKARGNE